MEQELSIDAPAKINLFLRVVDRRDDGYHDIETLMQKIELADRLHIRLQGDGICLSCPGSDLPCDSGNIVHRAAHLFFHEAGVKQSVEILLEKRIPVAAGLGGGSSDAAAVLLGLNRLLQNKLSLDRLLAMGRTLGADVPFFVRPESASWATGIGERLVEAPVMDECWIVLVNPGFAVSTKWVYENFALTTRGNPYIVGRETRLRECGEKLEHTGDIPLSNDLESVTGKRYPELGVIKDELLAAGAVGAMMSGSGPTVFGIFIDEKQAASCKGKIERLNHGKVFLTRPQRL